MKISRLLLIIFLAFQLSLGSVVINLLQNHAYAQDAQSNGSNNDSQTASSANQNDINSIVNSNQPSDDPAEEGDQADAPPVPSTPLTDVALSVENMSSRRTGVNSDKIENTLPPINMSQCDAQLVRQGKIDKRLINTLNYLVRDVKKGGAGMSFLQVTFNKSCETDVPDLIGGAYPVDLPDDSKQPQQQAPLPGATNSDSSKNASNNSSPVGNPNVSLPESQGYNPDLPIYPSNSELANEVPAVDDQTPEDTASYPPPTPPSFDTLPIEPSNNVRVVFTGIPLSDLNQQKRDALTSQINSFYSEVNNNYPYHNSKLNTFALVSHDKIFSVCDKGADACYIPNGGKDGKLAVIVLDTQLFGSTSQWHAVLAHEILHSFQPHLDMSNSVPGSAADAAYDEMMVEYFGNKHYPDSDNGYQHLTQLVPMIESVVKAAGENNPEDLLQRAIFKDGFKIIDDRVDKYLQKPFVEQLGKYISPDPDKQNTQAAKEYLNIVLAKVQRATGQLAFLWNNKLLASNSTPLNEKLNPLSPFSAPLYHDTTPIVNSISNLITPVAKAASLSNASGNEPQGTASVHDNGQAADITAAGLVMCTSKSGGFFGLGAKTTRQAPRPVKVAWQTDAGVSSVQAPFGTNFNQMAESQGLNQFLDAFTSADGSFQSNALQGAFTMMGFQALASLAGVKPGSFDPNTAALNYHTIGYSLLADIMNLPDASVFNPLITPQDQVGNPYDSGHSNTERLLKNGFLRSVEKDLKLPAFSLDGASYQDVLASAGQRRLEQILKLAPGSLNQQYKNSDDYLKAIGYARIDTFFHLPQGSAARAGSLSKKSLVESLASSIQKQLSMPDSAQQYAQTLVTSSLGIPSSVSISDIVNKSSSFWSSDTGKQTKTNFSRLDQQFYPSDVLNQLANNISSYSNPDLAQIFEPGAVPAYDNTVKTKPYDITYGMVTGDLSPDQVANIFGTGALAESFGAYNNSSPAYDVPNDPPATAVLPDGTEISIPLELYSGLPIDQALDPSTFGDFGQDPSLLGDSKYGIMTSSERSGVANSYIAQLFGTSNVPANTTVKVPKKNDFLTNLLGGKKDFLVAFGADAIAKALGAHPDERSKWVKKAVDLTKVIPTGGLIGGKNGTINGSKRDKLISNAAVYSLEGVVADALAGQIQKITFSKAKANMSIELSPDEFASTLGETLSANGSNKDAKARAEARFANLANMGKAKFGDLFSNAAKNAIGDDTLTNILFAYDQKRPATQATIDSFQINDFAQVSYTLSQPATNITEVKYANEGQEKTADYRLSSDHLTLTIIPSSIQDLGTSGLLTIKYTSLAHKAGQPAQISPDTFIAMLSNPSTLSNIAAQYGAARASKALKLPANSLGFLANLISPVSGNTGGIVGEGQVQLAQQAGVDPATLNGSSWPDVAKKLSQDEIDSMFRLEKGWYSRIMAKDPNYVDPVKGNSIIVQVWMTDDFYKIERDSTMQLLTGEITFDQYKRRIGNGDIKFNLGNVLASKVDIHVAGYRLTAADFTDVLNGSWGDLSLRVGARLQEKTHGMPPGSLAKAIMNGDSSSTMWLLGTNIIASTFHLNSIDLSNAHSIADVKSQIGVSSAEQVLGFKSGKLQGDNPLDMAHSAGAEQFATAFGFVLPDSIKEKLKQFTSSYRPEYAQQERDKIVYDYLAGIIGPAFGAEASFPDTTLQRFDQLDHIFNIPINSTHSFMTYQLSGKDYIKKISDKAVETGITTSLASALGIDEKYAIEGKQIVDGLKKGDNCDQQLMNGVKVTKQCSDAFAHFAHLVGGLAGLNFDTVFGFDKGTTDHIMANLDNARELKRTFVSQGAKNIARFAGLKDGYLTDYELKMSNGKVTDFEGAFRALGDARIAQAVNIPGYKADDAHYLLTGRFSDGLMLIGAAKMADSKDMKAAGITYQDLKNSIVGDPVKESEHFWSDFQTDHPEINVSSPDMRLELEATGMVNPLAKDTSNREYMTEARQNVSFKFMDYQAIQLIGKDKAGLILPGFSRALVGGQYSYMDYATGKQVKLTGDSARTRYATDFMVNYAVNKVNIGGVTLSDIGLSPNVADTLVIYATQHKDDKWLQDQLKGQNGIANLGSSFEKLTSKVFKGFDLAPGTGQAVINFAFSNNVSQFGTQLWTAWQGKVFEWADKALGFKNGTAQVMYSAITQYTSALSSYRSQISIINTLTDTSAVKATDTFTFVKNGHEVTETGTLGAQHAKEATLGNAKNQFNAQTAMIIATVASFVFQKQISQIETAIGLAPGTLMYLIQYLIHPDPISLGLFIFFNFFWGKSVTSCGIDYYPRPSAGNFFGGSSLGGPADTPPAVLAIQAALHDYTPTGDQASLTDAEVSQALKNKNNAIDSKLTPPKPFNGASNDDYRKGVKAAAQYEVKRVIGSILLRPENITSPNTPPCNIASLKPCQIGTLSLDDVNYFEKISSRPDLYGPLQSRGLKGPLYDKDQKMTDRIYIGF